MLEGIPLMCMIVFGIDYAWILCVDNTSYVVSCVINFSKLLSVIRFLRLCVHSLFCSHLDHLSPIPHQIVSRTHMFGKLLGEHLEPFELNEFN